MFFVANHCRRKELDMECQTRLSLKNRIQFVRMTKKQNEISSKYRRRQWSHPLYRKIFVFLERREITFDVSMLVTNNYKIYISSKMRHAFSCFYSYKNLH